MCSQGELQATWKDAGMEEQVAWVGKLRQPVRKKMIQWCTLTIKSDEKKLQFVPLAKNKQRHTKKHIQSICLVATSWKISAAYSSY